jgi:hypothetical protein
MSHCHRDGLGSKDPYDIPCKKSKRPPKGLQNCSKRLLFDGHSTPIWNGTLKLVLSPILSTYRLLFFHLLMNFCEIDVIEFLTSEKISSGSYEAIFGFLKPPISSIFKILKHFS